MYTLLVAALLTAAAYSLRRFTPKTGFLHSDAGLFFISMANGLLAAAADAIVKQGITKEALIPALANAIMSAVAAANPSIPAEKKEEEEIAAPRRGAAGFVGAFLLLVIALVGLLGLAMACSGCATTGGRGAEQAVIKCEMGALPAALGKIALAGLEMALNQNSNPSDLEQVAMGAAPGQAECAFQALLAWLSGPSTPAAADAPVGQALLAAHSEVAREHARAVLRAYLAHRPTACGPRSPRVLGSVDLDSPPFAAAPGVSLTLLQTANILAPPELPFCDPLGEASADACRPLVIEDGQP